MRRQRNMFQTREQDKTPEKDLNSEKGNDLKDAQQTGEDWMNTMIISTELENIKRNLTELKNTITEIKTIL